jgi:hypothetical protein
VSDPRKAGDMPVHWSAGIPAGKLPSPSPSLFAVRCALPASDIVPPARQGGLFRCGLALPRADARGYRCVARPVGRAETAALRAEGLPGSSARFNGVLGASRNIPRLISQDEPCRGGMITPENCFHPTQSSSQISSRSSTWAVARAMTVSAAP